MNPRRYFWYALFLVLAIAALTGAAWILSTLEPEVLP